MAPPGMPKTTSTSSSSRERTSDLAPVAGSAVNCWPLDQSAERGRATKNPSCEARRGERVTTAWPSGHAPRKYYDESLHADTVANSSKHCQVEHRNRHLARRDMRVDDRDGRSLQTTTISHTPPMAVSSGQPRVQEKPPGHNADAASAPQTERSHQ